MKSVKKFISDKLTENINVQSHFPFKQNKNFAWSMLNDSNCCYGFTDILKKEGYISIWIDYGNTNEKHQNARKWLTENIEDWIRCDELYYFSKKSDAIQFKLATR